MADLGKLQAKIEQLRTRIAEQEEREERIIRLAQLIRSEGWSKSDIKTAFQIVDEGRGIPQTRRGARKGTRPALYRHPENPELVWSGWARRPKWIIDLLDKGHKLDDLLIAKSGAHE